MNVFEKVLFDEGKRCATCKFCRFPADNAFAFSNIGLCVNEGDESHYGHVIAADLHVCLSHKTR